MANEFEASQDEELIARLYRNIQQVPCQSPHADGECWESTYARIQNGYCLIRHTVDGESEVFYVHRLSWAYYNGREIGEGLFICHHCDNPCCVNPEHLFEDTNQGNILDASSKGRIASGKDHHNVVLNWQIVFWIRMNCQYKINGRPVTRQQIADRLYDKWGIETSRQNVGAVINSDDTAEHIRDRAWADPSWCSVAKRYVDYPMGYDESWGDWY